MTCSRPVVPQSGCQPSLGACVRIKGVLATKWVIGSGVGAESKLQQSLEQFHNNNVSAANLLRFCSLI